MCKMYGKDYGYAHTRLSESIARLSDGTPVLINVVHSDGVVEYWRLSDIDSGGAKRRCHLDDIDTTPVSLGYVNLEDGCAYVSRIPVRRYKQGLQMRGNLQATNGGTGVITYSKLAELINGKYPSLLEIIGQKQPSKAANPFSKASVANVPTVSKTRLHITGGKAWSRNWCLVGKQVFYRGEEEPVGELVDGQRIQLHKRYQYLKESLQESL